jgi:hypothetical protein
MREKKSHKTNERPTEADEHHKNPRAYHMSYLCVYEYIGLQLAVNLEWVLKITSHIKSKYRHKSAI